MGRLGDTQYTMQVLIMHINQRRFPKRKADVSISVKMNITMIISPKRQNVKLIATTVLMENIF